MATTFNQVPDWTSWQYQGTNVATPDLDGEGSPELMVLRVDDPTPVRIEASTAWAEGWMRSATSPAGDPGSKFPVGVQRITRAQESLLSISVRQGARSLLFRLSTMSQARTGGSSESAGGNPDKESSVNWLPPDPLEEMWIEIFSPPYLFKKVGRPAIDAAPAETSYGANATIKTAQATQITTVNLIRPAVTTHSFNGTQRLIDVHFVVIRPDQLKASIPGSRTIAPPGWYMLFITDRDGVPSVAHWVHLS